MGTVAAPRTVIVGNGVCGIEAALALRRREASAPIAIVSDEHDHFFSRPALMYVFAGQMTLRGTEPYDRELYPRMQLDRVRGRVRAVDTEARSLRMEDGATIAYDRLLLAAGSRARPAPWPGSEGPGVHAFVTLRDLERLDAGAAPGQRAVVIGGGLIGVEVAEVLAARGLRVTFVIREAWYFPLALESREAALVADHVRAHGVDVRLGAAVEEVLRSEGGKLRGVRVAGEDIPCDLVVAAIGVVPNTAFLDGSGIARSAGGAIEVDEGLHASAAGVWAAGDCANVTWIDGTRRPEQLWYTARDQGRVAAASMAGDYAVYRRGTWYNSAKFFDLEYTTAGWIPALIDAENRPVPLDPSLRTWFQRVPGAYASERIVCRGDRVVGFNMLGGRWNHEPLLEWIDERRTLDWVLPRLSEAQFDEELTPRFRVRPEARVD
jgi:NADPH-dependent 2,4-dienoyl-CoA reductase/sulfur reductase-like enzyme